MRATKNAATAAATGTWAILLTAFVVTILYVGRQLLIPLALAAMLTLRGIEPEFSTQSYIAFRRF